MIFSLLGKNPFSLLFLSPLKAEEEEGSAALVSRLGEGGGGGERQKKVKVFLSPTPPHERGLGNGHRLGSPYSFMGSWVKEGRRALKRFGSGRRPNSSQKNATGNSFASGAGALSLLAASKINPPIPPPLSYLRTTTFLLVAQPSDSFLFLSP